LKLCTVVSLATAVLLLSGCSQPAIESGFNIPAATPAQTTATPDEIAFARANYAKHCLACHGAEGEGGLVNVDETRLKVPSLTEGHALKHNDDEFLRQIRKGGDGMPKFEDKLSPEETHALVRFIRREFQGK
jgi:mono/diheme cytochrome c family protein